MGEEERVDGTEIKFDGFRTVQGDEVEEAGRHSRLTWISPILSRDGSNQSIALVC